jgi:hypothetical protein
VFPIVVAVYLLIEITKKMERFNRNVGATDTALEKCPEVFESTSLRAVVCIYSKLYGQALGEHPKPAIHDHLKTGHR